MQWATGVEPGRAVVRVLGPSCSSCRLNSVGAFRKSGASAAQIGHKSAIASLRTPVLHGAERQPTKRTQHPSNARMRVTTAGSFTALARLDRAHAPVRLPRSAPLPAALAPSP